MSGQVACSISFRLDDKNQTILIDTIEDVDISLSSTITTHPVANGDLIADHMYKEPLSLTLKGAFGINSGTRFTTYSGPQSLGYIQKLFERIKNEAVICKVMKLDNTLGPQYPSGRFLVRNNLVLSQISWTEGINTLGFSFTFTEIMLVTYKSYQVNTDDRYLPSVELAEQRAFSQTFLSWEKLDSLVISILYDAGLITQEFLQDVASNSGWIIGGVIGANVGIGSIIAMIVSGSATAGPMGLAIGAAAAGITALGYGIYKIVDNIIKTAKYKIEAFTNYEKDKESFENFIGVIHTQVIEFVNNILVYEFDLGENKDGTSKSIAVNAYNDYYILDFIRKNTHYSSDVYNVYRVIVSQYLNGEPRVIKTILDTSALPITFDRCDATNSITKIADTNYYMFLLQGVEYNTIANGGHSFSGGGRSFESGDNQTRYVSSYLTYSILNGKFYLIATPLDPTEFWNRLGKVIESAFKRAG